MPLLFQRTETEKGNDTLPAALIQEQLRAIDWRVLATIAGTSLLIWLISLWYTGYECSQSFAETCIAQQVVFWVVPLGALISLTVSFSITALYAYHIASKERLANAFYQHFDNADVGLLQAQIIDRVASVIAQSLATGELDTLSQNITNNQSTTTLGTEPPKKDSEKETLKASQTLDELN